MLAARIILGTLSLAVTVMAADFVGTWKLNLTKSKPRNGNDVASETIRIEQTGPNAYRSTFDAVLNSGQKVHQEINRIYDGKEHPVTGTGSKPEGTSEICELVNASTRKITRKTAGATSELTTTVSPDGKVMTNVWKGALDETLVFERQ